MGKISFEQKPLLCQLTCVCYESRNKGDGSTRRIRTVPAAERSLRLREIQGVLRALGGPSHRSGGGWRAAVGRPCRLPAAQTGPARTCAAQSCAAAVAPVSSPAPRPPSKTPAHPATRTPALVRGSAVRSSNSMPVQAEPVTLHIQPNSGVLGTGQKL